MSDNIAVSFDGFGRCPLDDRIQVTQKHEKAEVAHKLSGSNSKIQNRSGWVSPHNVSKCF